MKRWVGLLMFCAACLTPPVTEASDAAKRSIRMKIANSSPHPIREAYVAGKGQSTWGPNLLAKPLERGGEAAVLIPGGCGTYDLRFVVDEKTEYLEDELEFCEDDDVVTLGTNTVRRSKAHE